MKTILQKLKYSGLIIAASMMISPKANALTVIDPANLAQAVAQVNQMVQQYARQLEQLNEAIRQGDAMTGSRAMGSLLNSSVKSDLRRSLPDDLLDMINLPAAGGLGTSATATQGIYNNYITEYDPISGADFVYLNPTSEISKSHDRNVGATYANLSASEASYRRATERISNYEQMLNELDASDDVKTTVDLQARIMVENGIALSEMAKMNALRMQLDASNTNFNITNKRRAAQTIRYNSAKALESFN